MTRAETGGGHGHATGSLAVRAALHGIKHQKVIVVVTGISVRDGEYDVEVECILIDEEESPLGDDEGGSRSRKNNEEEVIGDFYKAELDAEKEKAARVREFYHHLQETLMEAMEQSSESGLFYDLYFTEQAAATVDLGGHKTLSEEGCNLLKENYVFIPGLHYSPTRAYA